MNPKVSHVQIQTAPSGGRWYAKEVASTDKSEKTLLFFQREGPRSLKDFISDKLQGVRSGRAIAEKHMASLGLSTTGSIRGDAGKGNAGTAGGTGRLTEAALDQHLKATIQQTRQQGQAATPNPQEATGQGPGISLRDAMSAKDRATRDAFCSKLWGSYSGSSSKADFMQMAKDAYAMATGKMSFTDAALSQKAAAFLKDIAAHTSRTGTLDGEFRALQNAFHRRAGEAASAAQTRSAETPETLENNLVKALNSGDKQGFCDAITQEFVRVSSDKPDWNPELDTLAFRARMALAFDIAKDEQRVQAGIEAVDSEMPQAKQMLYMAAKRGVTSDPHSVNEALRALESLPGLGIDPEIVGLLKEMHELVRQARDQDAY